MPTRKTARRFAGLSTMNRRPIRVTIGFVSTVGDGRELRAPRDGTVPVTAATSKMTRRRSGRVVGGVAGGLADHLGVSVQWVRVVLAVLAGFGGAGVVAYAMLWVFVPQEPARAREHRQSTSERQQALALIALGIALGAAFGMLSGAASGWVIGPIGIALVGAAVVWREADEDQRRRWAVGARSSLLGTGGRRAITRVLAGVALVAAGIAVFLLNSVDLSDVQFALVAVFATLVGVGVLTVPWWLRLVRDLGEERRARIRTEERAEIAAHLHDSVLQTLALIQKQADAPREVQRLARGQERQLRTWLYGPTGYGRPKDGKSAASDGSGPAGRGQGTLADAVAAASGEVEDSFAISVQQVVVGDCALDERLTALVQACREAMVNAAKHSGSEEVSVYAEVGVRP
jgi:phage shock protein PspC (stress-responsive transcriptional regulator)